MRLSSAFSRASEPAWLALALTLVLCACADDPACDEDPRAQVLDETVTLTHDGRSITVELADDLTERERGLRYRTCDVRGLLLAQQQRAPLPIWMCEVRQPLDLIFLNGANVVEVVSDAPPCDPPCSSCELYGEDLPVTAVLEVPSGRFPVSPGDRIGGIPER